jgi:protocatechuate 3,4-dioxygenase beta subunit
MTDANNYTYGERIRGTFTITDFAGDPVDPSTVKFFHLRPDSSEALEWEYSVDPEITQDSAGVYHVDLDTDAEGAWKYRWTGSGNVATAKEGMFYVDDSPFIA